MDMTFVTREIPLADRGFRDLNPVRCGDEACQPGHISTMRVRNCWLIHYVFSGKGTYECPRGKYKIDAGNCFVIRPGEETEYIADADDPWYYIWIGLTGELASRFDEFGDVVPIDDPNLFTTMLDCREFSIGREEFLAGKAFLLLSSLWSKRRSISRMPKGREYAERARNYINQYYYRRISVEQLAEALHIDRHYLVEVFRRENGCSVKDYITNVKLDNARRLLRSGFNVARAAELTGYNDVSNFSKMYKKRFGEPPSGERMKAKKSE